MLTSVDPDYDTTTRKAQLFTSLYFIFYTTFFKLNNTRAIQRTAEKSLRILIELKNHSYITDGPLKCSSLNCDKTVAAMLVIRGVIIIKVVMARKETTDSLNESNPWKLNEAMMVADDDGEEL